MDGRAHKFFNFSFLRHYLRITISLFCFLLSASFIFSEGPETVSSPLEADAYSHFCRGVLYERDKEWQKALQEFQEALKYDPKAGGIYLKCGALFLKLKKVDQAILEFQKALGASYEIPYMIHFLLGVAYHSNQQWDQAIIEYQKAIVLEPTYVGSYVSLADLYYQRSDLLSAQAYLEKGVGQMPDMPVLWFKLGLIYGKEKKFKEAIDAVKKAVNLKEHWMEARLSLALFYEAAEEKNMALHEYEEVLKIAPLNIPVYRRMATLYHAQGETEKAEKIYQLLKDLYPEDAINFVALGYLAVKKGKPEAAIQILEEARAKKVSSIELYFLLGLAYEAKQSLAKAVEIYKQGMQLYGENDQLNFHIGNCFYEQGQMMQAETFLQKAIQLNPKNADALNCLGYLWADHGLHLKEAIELIKRALALEPSDAAYLDSLGWAYYKSKMLKESIEALKKSVQLMSDDALIRSHLGDAYFENGQWSEALIEWGKSLEFNPANESLKKKVEEILKKQSNQYNEKNSHS